MKTVDHFKNNILTKNLNSNQEKRKKHIFLILFRNFVINKLHFQKQGMSSNFNLEFAEFEIMWGLLYHSNISFSSFSGILGLIKNNHPDQSKILRASIFYC